MHQSIGTDFLDYKRSYGLPEQISERERKLLAQGVPFQKILGYVDFSNLRLEINERVFIPRYETLELIDLVARLAGPGQSVCDLGAGSGLIGLTLKKNRPDLKVSLVENDPAALRQTRLNALKNNLAVEVIDSDWLTNLKPAHQFDLIVSNPPYIKDSTFLEPSVVEHEPRAALWAGPDGNNAYRAILSSFKNYLKPGGYLVFEIGADNVSFLRAQNFTLRRDINRKWRIAFRRF